MFQSNAFQSNAYQTPINAGIPSSITGGHFLPKHHKNKRTLSNVLVVYEKAQKLPRKETKELRDAIHAFVAPEVASTPAVPDIIKVNYEALQANQSAYDKFSQALSNIEKRLIEIKAAEEEDEELLLISIISVL